MSMGELQIILALVSTIIIPVGIWFATFTLGRLRHLEEVVDVLQTRQAEAVTRGEFNDRMDKLQTMIIDTIIRNAPRSPIPRN